jgi:hypothetical protein
MREESTKIDRERGKRKEKEIRGGQKEEEKRRE